MTLKIRTILTALIICAGLLALPAMSFAQGNVRVLDLDGVGDYVTAADSDNLTDFTDGSFTVQAWVLTQGLVSFQSIAAKWDVTGNQRSWAFMLTSNGALRAFLSADGESWDMWQTEYSVLSAGTWTHVAWVVDPGGTDKIKFYANNVEKSHTNATTDPPSSVYNSTASMDVGYFNETGGGYFWGYLDEIRITDGVLTSFPDDVLDFPLTPDSDTEVLYHFNFASGDAIDAATIGGNPANNGTLMGDATRRMFDNLGPGRDLPLPVTLVSISAIGADELVKVSWSTESEYDNLGFHIYRSLNSQSSFERITSDLIPSQGFTAATQYYQYIDDRDLVNGITYYYKISDTDVNGRERTHQLIATATPITEAFLPGENTALAGYQLSQNYPNPFNASTTINYYVRDGGNVKLAVYNINGEEVSTLVDNFKEMGEYTQEFDASLLPAGIYFVRLTGDYGYDNIKKMLFLK